MCRSKNNITVSIFDKFAILLLAIDPIIIKTRPCYLGPLAHCCQCMSYVLLGQHSIFCNLIKKMSWDAPASNSIQTNATTQFAPYVNTCCLRTHKEVPFGKETFGLHYLKSWGAFAMCYFLFPLAFSWVGAFVVYLLQWKIVLHVKVLVCARHTAIYSIFI